MNDVEPLIVSSFERIFPQPDADPDWDGVLRRSGVRSRRYLVALAVVAALLLAPAAWAITRAFEGKPAPPSVKSFFRYSNRASTQIAKTLGKTEPKAIANKAHGVIQVKTTDGLLDLWAAPARGGGTCQLVAWQPDPSHPHTSEDGGCYAANPPRSNLTWSSGGDFWHRNYKVVTGYAYGDATTVRITLSNGRTINLPVVEHLFLGALHQSLNWRQRPKIVSMAARDTHGHVVGYWRRARTR